MYLLKLGRRNIYIFKNQIFLSSIAILVNYFLWVYVVETKKLFFTHNNKLNKFIPKPSIIFMPPGMCAKW